MPSADPVFWPISKLLESFRGRELSPVELTEEVLRRIERLDGQLHSYLSVSPELALSQAREAEESYGDSSRSIPALLGVPTSIKDLFDVKGQPTTLGSLLYRDNIASADSPTVLSLRNAGAVFVGKSNTAEFGQSATTENLIGNGCGNPWDPTRTAGGSSGGAAASVGAGLASLGLGSDGGGSIRIPSAMCGLFGLKFTFSPSSSADSFRAMTEFVCPGPITRSVADARLMSSVLLGREMEVSHPVGLRIAWCPAPEGRPVAAGVRASTRRAIDLLEEMGHRIEEVPIPTEGWSDAFGPLVLADEWRHRGHLLESAEGLTDYSRRSIEAAELVTGKEIESAKKLKAEFQDRIETLFEHYDLIITPTTAAVAFPMGERPSEIDGRHVGALWGSFPFTAAFNVSGSPAASIPVGISDGMPVGLQVVGPGGGEASILDLCEQLEEAVAFPATLMEDRWKAPGVEATAPKSMQGAPLRNGSSSDDTSEELLVERQDGLTVIRFNRPSKRNALTSSMLKRLQETLEGTRTGGGAVILTGGDDCFSAGMDLREVQGRVDDLRLDDLIAETWDAIRKVPVPVIAAIEGPCYGAAVDLAVACDIRLASETARFCIPAVNLGLLYRPEAIAKMIASIGRPDTIARLIVFGDQIQAEEATTTGLVGRMVGQGAALDSAVELAKRSSGSSPEAVKASKELINEVVDRSQPDLHSWETVRRDLLESESRSKAISNAKHRFGVAVEGKGEEG
jgi:Asp-tRNA(Asn)/Glu-tRNA(Gln) amidotransferase A subunit family amidase/enoyl-CoA hydratase/carnithine racemase